MKTKIQSCFVDENLHAIIKIAIVTFSQQSSFPHVAVVNFGFAALF
jgi:hypothetical protein